MSGVDEKREGRSAGYVGCAEVFGRQGRKQLSKVLVTMREVLRRDMRAAFGVVEGVVKARTLMATHLFLALCKANVDKDAASEHSTSESSAATGAATDSKRLLIIMNLFLISYRHIDVSLGEIDGFSSVMSATAVRPGFRLVNVQGYLSDYLLRTGTYYV